jgi:hypothetical protein
MFLIKKYYFYKRLLQITLALNVLFICWGVSAGIRLLQTHDMGFLEIFIVGLGVLTVGVILPAWGIYKLEQQIVKMRSKLIELVSKFIATWATERKTQKGEFYKKPDFWINLALLAVEEIGETSSHPIIKMLVEVSPFIRKEIKNTISDS